MKKINAFIRPNMIDDVIFALHQIDGFPGATMSEVKKVARETQTEQPSFDMPTFICLDIFCCNSLVNNIVAAIKSNAHTGRNEDGIIYVSAVESETVI